MLRFIEKETKTEDKSIPVTAQVARESLYSFVGYPYCANVTDVVRAFLVDGGHVLLQCRCRLEWVRTLLAEKYSPLLLLLLPGPVEPRPE